MARIQWARASQFNWVFDNMGGAPLQEAVAGNWSGATALVDADGRVTIDSPNPGGGQVCLVRGVWLTETAFPWEGFWADPLSGDLTNYYLGGSYANLGNSTIITLGTPLPANTPVQLFYLYLTGEKAAKYESLNNYPCIRRAYRARDDYTYDFAVDRILDLMVFLHLAGREQGRDYQPMLQFLWDAFYPREESCVSPLIYDSFERQRWDRGAYLLYRGATTGNSAFQDFQIKPGVDSPTRELHIQVDLPTTQDAAWCGYGLDWSLAASPFDAVDRLQLKLRGPGGGWRVHNLTKVGSGSATMVVMGDYTPQEKRKFVVQIQTSGEVGQATCRWSKNAGQTWEATGVITGDRQHPVPLWGGIQVYWEGGPGTDLVAGDYWQFWGGDPEEHPRRLLVSLNDSTAADADPWGPQHTYIHALPDRFSETTAFELSFDQFWHRDNLIHDGDRVRAMWGAWYSAQAPDDSDVSICDLEETLVFGGETFYTPRQVTWDLSPQATGWGAWVGIDTQRCDSTGQTQFNFLIKPVVSGANYLNLRVSVKDARDSYFDKYVNLQVNSWQRVTVNLGEMVLDWGSYPLTHPLKLVEFAIPSSPPSNGVLYITDLKFGDHLTFAGAQRLRLMEFKMEHQGLPDHEWWLDEVGLNLEAEDPYPFAPRLAISLTPYGQNPWRGLTPVHYAQPLAPYLVGALNLTQNYLNLHRDAQDEFQQRYEGIKGPILPTHTRNDVENIALCGEEDFTGFSWWPKYRNYGLVSGAWHFNAALTDASGHGHTLLWSSGSPTYVPGVCQPGNTAVSFDGTAHGSLASNSLLEPGTQPFSLTLIIKAAAQGSGWLWLVDKMGADGWVIQTKEVGSTALQLKVTTSAGDSYSDIPSVLDGNWHMLTWMVSPGENKIYKVKDGTLLGNDNLAVGSGLNNTAYLNFGSSGVFSLDYFKYERRVLPSAEYENAWGIVQGTVNGSAYPEVGSGLGQYWAFMRLAQYFFISNDPQAWAVLENWLDWLDSFVLADGPGWKFPQNFSEYGFVYGPGYGPGMAASLVLGCLYIFLRNGDDRAGTLARRLLDDLRENRGDQDFGGYQSDYHYAWLNGLVLQAFGLAKNGAAGQAYTFPSTPQDEAHFEALLAWAFNHTGDGKPNVLNADLIPFSYCEAGDIWDYAPHYLSLAQMGSLEGVVCMLGAALEYAKHQGDWVWFQRLLRFILLDNLVELAPGQTRSLTMSYDLEGVKNLVRLRYADYDRNNSQYAEARDDAAIDAWGELAADLDCRYGGPVILENPEVAQLLASRLLQRLAHPWELAEAETWLEAARIELGDTVAVSSDFHGLDREEFTVSGKDLDLGRRTTRLTLSRPLNRTGAWAVDDPGTAYDNYAIDQNSPYDANWQYRAYGG
ncbi:MAG: hypothetical protein HY790_08550 [Deltaproteobacteria bacterium]|nr:hypothetical protein [Deltaproteobacteria bacterium]